MRKTWVFREADTSAVQQLAQALDLPQMIAQLLVQRGCDAPEAAQQFLCSDLSALPDPKRLADLPQAVKLLKAAIKEKKKILIVGDYDADGLTGTALLYRLLRAQGGQVSFHIPHRIDDGYGLKTEVVHQAAAQGVKLLITVDCGTTSFEELKAAQELGLESIVVDHHELESNRRPPATAFLNPLNPESDYPGVGLSSVGVAFTLARGFAGRLEPVLEHLDLVAVGTVADMVPLTSENRVLVRTGLHALAGTQKPGLRALLDQKDLSDKTLSTEDISFSLAPPLNAMGRMGSAEISLQLLTTEDKAEAGKLVKVMDKENRARRALEREALALALSKVTREINFNQDRVIVLEDERWHPGIIGILATRITKRFHRPTVIIAKGDSRCRGSARSVAGFHLVEALEVARDHLVEFGGHAAAAGLTIKPDRIDAFRGILNQVARDRLDPKDLVPSVELDGELPLEKLTVSFMRDLEMLAPFGMGNPRPVFSSPQVRVPDSAPPTGFHPFAIPVQVRGPEGLTFEALQPKDLLRETGDLRRAKGPVAMAYSPVRPALSEEITLNVRDLKLSSPA